MTELDAELALRALGERLRSEPTADLAGVVAARLTSPRRRSRPARWQLAFALAAVALLLSAVAVAATPRLRDAVRDWLGLAGVRVETVDTLPPTVPAASIPELRLGRRVDAARAMRLLGSPLPSSPIFGTPDRIFATTGDGGSVITLLWLAGGPLAAEPHLPAVGALLTLATPRYGADPLRLAKQLGLGTRAEFVDLDASPRVEGVWIEGAPHAVTTLDGRTETFRLASNVLIWRFGERVYRLESALGQEEAAAIAATLEAAGG